MKKIVCILGILLLSIKFSALWAYDFSAVSKGQTLYYTIISDTIPYTAEVTIEDYYEMSDVDYPNDSVFIPDSVEYNGKIYAVIGIGDYAFYKCDSITGLRMGENIKYINYKAFYECTALEFIKISESVESINHFAFYSCSKINDIYIPQSVKYIGYYVFTSCSLLNAIKVDEKNKYYKSVDDILYSYNLDTLKACPTNKIGEIEIHNTIVVIQAGAFYECNGLWGSLTFPSSLRYIENNAFFECQRLNFVLNDGLISIDIGAFYNCYFFSGVLHMPNTINNIGDGSFSGCHEITSLILSDRITCIPSSAFSSCDKLKNVTFGKNILLIEDFAFEGCRTLKRIEIPNRVKNIGSMSFLDCYALMSVVIGDSVKKIGSMAFAHCYGLKRIVIGKSVELIGIDAFSFNDSLQEIYCKAVNPPFITTSNFNSTQKNIPVYVPCGSKTLYEADTLWNQFTNFIEVDYTYELTTYSNDELRGSVSSTYADCISQQAVIEAFPANGCVFTRWNDGNTDNPRSIILNKDTSFTAIFDIKSGFYQITVLANDSSYGEVTGTGIYSENSLAKISATPLFYAYRFDKWNDGNSEEVRNIRVTCDSVFTAFFYDYLEVSHIENTSPLRLYPNPAGYQFTLDNAQSLMKEVCLYDVMGRKVQHLPVNAPSTTIDVSDLPNGIYVVKISTASGVLVRKVQVMR
ncbi:MAG: leucine-rich repeat domain-containing protein [Bacteroidales bacterium]|jgi:hypothetical protein|nr:leucine-rich repeat domain-containing protein [Bacteroidales bacterium]